MGNSIEIDQNTINKDKLETLNPQWIICSDCCSIPLIKLFIENYQVQITISCKCLRNGKEKFSLSEYKSIILKKRQIINKTCYKHNKKKAFFYCLNCQIWLCQNCFYSSHKKLNHIYHTMQIKIIQKCFFHNEKNAIGYCSKCDQYLCEYCVEIQKKFKHQVMIFNEPNLNIKKNKKWDQLNKIKEDFKNYNQKLKNTVIQKLSNGKDIEIISDLINKIEEAYKINERINNEIYDALSILFSNFNSAYEHHIYNPNLYFNIINNTHFEKIKFNIHDSTEEKLLKTSKNLISYFKNTFIIKTNPILCLNSFNYDKKNKISNITQICIIDQYRAVTLNSEGNAYCWNYHTYYLLSQIENEELKKSLEDENNNNNNNNNINNNNNNNNNNFNNNFNNFDDDNENGENVNPNIVEIDNENFNLAEVPGFDENDDFFFNNEEENDHTFKSNFCGVCYIPQVKYLVFIVDKNPNIQIYNTNSINEFKFETLLIGHSDNLISILNLSNGNLASYSKDQTLRIWDMITFQQKIILKFDIKYSYSCFTQLYDNSIIFAIEEFTIKLYNLEKDEFSHSFHCKSKPISYFQIPDKRLIISCDDSYVRIYKPPNYENFTYFAKYNSKIYSYLLIDQERLLIGEKDCNIKLLYLGYNEHFEKIGEHPACIGCIKKCYKYNKIISISWDNTCKIWAIGN